jgi:hypothetical protein
MYTSGQRVYVNGRSAVIQHKYDDMDIYEIRFTDARIGMESYTDSTRFAIMGSAYIIDDGDFDYVVDSFRDTNVYPFDTQVYTEKYAQEDIFAAPIDEVTATFNDGAIVVIIARDLSRIHTLRAELTRKFPRCRVARYFDAILDAHHTGVLVTLTADIKGSEVYTLKDAIVSVTSAFLVECDTIVKPSANQMSLF